MYDDLVKALRCCADSNIPCKSCPRCAQCTKDMNMNSLFPEAADAIEELEKKNEQLTKKLVRPRPPKRKACSCGKKKWVQWYHTVTGMWSLQCDNCGKSSRQVKYRSQLNAAWNEIADSEIDPQKEET